MGERERGEVKEGGGGGTERKRGREGGTTWVQQYVATGILNL